MRDRAVEQRGAAWVRSDGSRRAEMPVTAFDGSGLVSKLEILRGDLVDVLYQATKDSAPDYRFNSRISELERDDDAVAVTLAEGPSYGQT
jgi:2-polyprenyl-6-methoxyphenol hydroxylase-like FAD-dependent oxidoreductase